MLHLKSLLYIDLQGSFGRHMISYYQLMPIVLHDKQYIPQFQM